MAESLGIFGEMGRDILEVEMIWDGSGWYVLGLRTG